MSDIVVRQVLDSDLHSIAVIHKGQFGGHFLGKFSVALLTKFYRAFLEDSIFLIAENLDEPAGFVLGGEAVRLTARKKQFLTSDLGRLILESAVRPRLWGMVISRLFSLGPRGSQPVSGYEMRLLSIAVDDDSKGKGVASALVAEFEKSLTGYREYGLSVLADNSRAVAFYRKTGYTEEMRRGKSVYFFKTLPEDPVTRGKS